MKVLSLIQKQKVDILEFLKESTQEAKKVGGKVWAGHLQHGKNTVKIFSVDENENISVQLSWEFRGVNNEDSYYFTSLYKAYEFIIAALVNVECVVGHKCQCYINQAYRECEILDVKRNRCRVEYEMEKSGKVFHGWRSMVTLHNGKKLIIPVRENVTQAKKERWF